jgi:hypothetical protein
MVNKGKGIPQAMRPEDGRSRGFQRFGDVDGDEGLVL